MAGHETTKVLDPASGKVAYQYTVSPADYRTPEFISQRIDHDLGAQHAWETQERRWEFSLDYVLPVSTETRMDDGTTILIEHQHTGTRAEGPLHWMDRTTVRDAQGRVDHITENNLANIHRYDWQDIRIKSWDYNTETGLLDYEITDYGVWPVDMVAVDYDAAGRRDYVIEKRTDGAMIATDYDPATGLLDYVITTSADGRLLAEDYDAAGRLDFVIEKHADGTPVATDYDPATGLLDFVITTGPDGRLLAEDYDAAGRLDFVIEERTDGTMVATDYDPATGLLDYVITTSADGRLLAEDYDAAGRLDYVIERWPDGRMVATDHDLLDQHAWTTHRLAYDADGRLESVLLL